ncbi:MAG: hypothetical protein V7677_08295 [Motiliproteus sp.]
MIFVFTEMDLFGSSACHWITTMQDDEPLYGLLSLAFLLIFALWRQRQDIREHGEPSRGDRWRTYGYMLLWLPVLLGIFAISARLYILVSLVLFVSCYLLGFGMGPQGTYRQLRDAAFVAWILSLPICFVMWGSS